MSILQIQFDSDDDLKDFMSWLDNQGEQDFWIYEDCQDKKPSKVKYLYDKQQIIIKRQYI